MRDSSCKAAHLGRIRSVAAFHKYQSTWGEERVVAVGEARDLADGAGVLAARY